MWTLNLPLLAAKPNFYSQIIKQSYMFTTLVEKPSQTIIKHSRRKFLQLPEKQPKVHKFQR